MIPRLTFILQKIYTQSIDIYIPRDAEKGHINNSAEQWRFQLNKILHNASQEQVFEDTTAPLIQGCFQGYNGMFYTRSFDDIRDIDGLWTDWSRKNIHNVSF